MVNARSFLVGFRYSHKVAYVVEFSHLTIRLYYKRALLTEAPLGPSVVVPSLGEEEEDDEPLNINVGVVTPEIFDEDDLDNGFEIATPYTYEDLWDDDELCFKLQTIQHSDVMYIFSEKHPIMVLKRYANNNWRLEELELKGGPFLAMNTENTMLTSDGVTGTVQIAADQNLFAATDVGRLIRLRAYDDNCLMWAAGINITGNTIYVSDNKYYLAMGSGASGTRKPVHTEGIRSDGNVRWKYLGVGIGVVKITAVNDAMHVTAEVIERLPEGAVNGTVFWELGLIHQGATYPKSGAFFRNRFCFLINTETGPKVCLSAVGDYNNFADTEYGEATAETAITVPVLNTEFNEGKWLFADDVLFVGTGAAEFYIDAIAASSPMSNDNIKIAEISRVGSKAIMPVKIGRHILFADRYGLSLRDLAYDYYNDGYDQTDITLLGKHLFYAKLTAMCYQETPDKILWCLTADGKVAALTISSEQEVAALSRHDFSGEVESLTVIPNFEHCYDEVWFEIKRVIGSTTVRTVEYLESGMPVGIRLDGLQTNTLVDERNAENDYVKEMCCYLDSAVLFVRNTGNTAQTVAGLSHLEGEVVSIYADGVVLAPQVVINGEVKIPETAVRVLVGKPIKSQYIPQSVYIETENGSGIGETERISHVVLMLYLTGGGKIGPDAEHLSDILFCDSDEEKSDENALFSGLRDVLFNGRTSFESAEILIENDSPLPMNILAIVPHIN